jgi:APA family basic amino acid/polyamine antiporter
MIMAAPRILYAMTKDGLLPESVQAVNDGGTPSTALALTTGVAAAFLLSGTFEKVIKVVSFFIVAFITLSLISLFVLRRREPEAPRPYRAFGHPFTTGLALLGSLAFFVGAARSDPVNALIAGGVLAVSVPAYLLSS